MNERFEDRRLSGTINLKLKGRGRWTVDKTDICRSIIDVVSRYMGEGYRLTLRQLYYQLVAADLIPNHDTVYKKLSSLLDDLRYSGHIDWDAIEDRGRVPYLPYWVEGIRDALTDTARQYRLNRQQGQDKIVEVWTEKDAISGILKRITTRYHCRLVVNKGYSSSTAMYRAYERFVKHINEGNSVVVLYFGDHDPSGLDMVRDIEDRILTFLSKGERFRDRLVEDWWDNTGFGPWNIADWNGDYTDVVADLLDGNEDVWEKYNEGRRRFYLDSKESFIVRHIGLTMSQIEEFNPPPNPAKMTDPRAKWYLEEFGETSWEVDAIEPRIMESIVSSAIEEEIDVDKYQAVVEREREEKDQIIKISENLNGI